MGELKNLALDDGSVDRGDFLQEADEVSRETLELYIFWVLGR